MAKNGTVAVVVSLPKCDFPNCTKDATHDFKTKMGSWANGCREHWIQYRMSPELGLGLGQRLEVRS